MVIVIIYNLHPGRGTPRQWHWWQLSAAAAHFLGFIVCLSSLSIIRGGAAAVLNSNHAVKDEPEPVLVMAAAAPGAVRVESARQTGRDSRNSSAGNYDLHTDAAHHHHHQPDLGPTTALAPIVQPAIVQQLETPAEETKIVIKDESSCEEFKSNLTMTGCGWKFMVVF